MKDRGGSGPAPSAGTRSTHVCCRHERVGQRSDVPVPVEPRHEEDAERHVHQQRHHHVGLPVDGRRHFRRFWFRSGWRRTHLMNSE